MSLASVTPDAGPLLSALRELITIHHDALDRSTELLGALASGNLGAMQRAVATQHDVAAAIDAAERRRRAAEGALAAVLRPGRDTVTSSELLVLLPPAEAEQLRALRHELLRTVVRLQAVNNQAALLARNAQAVVARSMHALAPRVLGYGPRGELALPASRLMRRQAQRG